MLYVPLTHSAPYVRGARGRGGRGEVWESKRFIEKFFFFFFSHRVPHRPHWPGTGTYNLAKDNLELLILLSLPS